MPEKPGFVGVKMPGKTQPKDRSGGVPRCGNDNAQSIGI